MFGKFSGHRLGSSGLRNSATPVLSSRQVGRALRASRSNRLCGSHGVLALPRDHVTGRPHYFANRSRGRALGGSPVDAEAFEAHLKEVLKNCGGEKISVKVFTDTDKYIERARELNALSGEDADYSFILENLLSVSI